jgi:hypothetical protein
MKMTGVRAGVAEAAERRFEIVKCRRGIDII